jgi:hypothetical protein
MRILVALLAVTLIACARPAAIPPLTLPFPVDSVTNRLVAPGVIQRSIRSPRGPWAIQVLDVDLSKCYTAIAAKGAAGAVGRKQTSVILEELRASNEVIGGVNADFFSLAGFLGVPGGALIHRGEVWVGPLSQPLFMMDSAGTPRAGRIGMTGSISHRNSSQTVVGWNRTVPTGLNVYDARWGSGLDTSTGVVEVIVEGGNPGRVARIDTAVAGARIPNGGSVIVAGKTAPEDLKQWLRSLPIGDTVRVSLKLTPFHPLEAVGGRPVLLRDSVVTLDVETEGQPSFRARNPRTAVGIANKGKRLILVVIDGRQPNFSDGTTLRETADIMRDLGARDAINLDGGGSSAMVYMDPITKQLRVANRPSDATGERAVGDALAIVKGCR